MRKQAIILGVPVALFVCLVMARPNATQTRRETPGLDDTLSQSPLFIQLHSRVVNLENEKSGNGRYQIAATTVNFTNPDMSFAQVFMVDTKTGHVCQVVGSKAMKGELVGTSLPYCSQQEEADNATTGKSKSGQQTPVCVDCPPGCPPDCPPTKPPKP